MMNRLAIVTFAALATPSAVIAQFDSVPPRADVVIRWNRILLNAIRADHTPPPPATRKMAIVHAAIYDAVNAVYRTHQPYLVDVTALPGTSPEAAAAAAAYGTLTQLFPRQEQTFEREYVACLAEMPAGAGREQGESLGRFVANQMLQARRNDGSNTQRSYQVRRAPGHWEPTPPEYASPLLPGWGQVKPFAVRGQPALPPGPPPLTSAEYTRAFREVKALGGRTASLRTPDQTQIAWFWLDGEGTATPPGHWNEIAQTLALMRGQSLADNARMFALLNLTLGDTAILCWVCKFTYNFWRPVTAIRQANQDGNPQTDPDPTWTPLLPTPPFPAYTSGHSSFSGAAATVLAEFIGTDQIAFKSTSAGATRYFTSLWQAAEEAGRSRIYGGIHWDFDNTHALAAGRSIASFIVRSSLLPVTATAARIKN